MPLLLLKLNTVDPAGCPSSIMTPHLHDALALMQYDVKKENKKTFKKAPDIFSTVFCVPFFLFTFH
jgi:hypothetical protein